MKLLLIDNYDSFTYNLLHYFRYFTSEVEIARNDKVRKEQLEKCDKIVLSPGPGLPAEAGDCEKIILSYGAAKPILGICLGHQAIATAFGGELKNLKTVHHGIALNTIIIDENDYLFKNIPPTFKCGRYHSWVINNEKLPECLSVIAKDEYGEIMAVKHSSHDIHGLQFHPESILSDFGLTIIENWCRH